MSPQELAALKVREQEKASRRQAYRAAWTQGRDWVDKRSPARPAAAAPAPRAQRDDRAIGAEIEDTPDTVVVTLLEGYGRPLEPYRIAGLTDLDRTEVDEAVGRLLAAGKITKAQVGDRTTFELAAAEPAGARGGAR